MEATVRTDDTLTPVAAETTTRSGPVPLDPALLGLVAGGVAAADAGLVPEELDAPHGRW